MTTRTHFTFRVDKLDANGEVFEHVAGIEDFELAVATYQAALKRWPGDPIMLAREQDRACESPRRCRERASGVARRQRRALREGR